ncbi:MAG: hypothetical protein HUJ51_05240 [Eggerthellaceae bacterium]|nr:hypothetical protein [Eggerthellaceae bacterium]
MPAKDEAKRKRVGFKVTDRGIVYKYTDIMADDNKVRQKTSGAKAPYTNDAFAMAFASPEYVEVSTKLTALVRGREIECEIVPMLYYKRS